MVTTAMIRSLSIRCFGFAKIVRYFIPHPSNEGPGQHPDSTGTALTTDCLFLNPGSDDFAARSQSRVPLFMHGGHGAQTTTQEQ